jgi:hypothetical protein
VIADSPMLRGVTEKMGGALVLVCCPKDGCGELMWAHSTSTMGLGYMEVHAKPKVKINFPFNMDFITKK